VGIAIAIALSGAPSESRAGTCPVDPAIGSSAPAKAGVEARTRLLEARIERGARLSRGWALGWGLGLGALTVGQLAIAPTVPVHERPDWWVGAAASGVGALTRAVFIPRVLIERRRLRRRDVVGCARVAALEGALVRSARWERKGRGLLMHGLNLGFNVAVGLVLGLAFHRPIAANRLASIGAVVGEIMIITQPRFMMRSLGAYRSIARQR
jgi:hypothetical protein